MSESKNNTLHQKNLIGKVVILQANKGSDYVLRRILMHKAVYLH